MKKVVQFIKKEPVLFFASILAIITCIIIPIDKQYLDYFDYKTLSCLFCMLIIVVCLKSTNVFQLISRKLIGLFHTRRTVILSLIFGTFFFDMIVANDMSLITFLPLTYIVLHSTGNDKYLAITFILQTIAANMGGMITPYGNPQNLYLYSYYNIPTSEFVMTLLFQSIAVAILLCLSCSFIKDEPLTLRKSKLLPVDKKKLIIYSILFILIILTIFRVVPYLLTLPVVIITVFIIDKQCFKKVDYALLATFCVFFIFSGNMARIPEIKSFIASIILDNTLLAGIVSCQFISNVPTAIFLSKFTMNYSDLLVAVNVGSLGILISSLASLITLKEFLKHQPKNFWKYLGLYTLFNSIFLVVLLIITMLK